MYYPDSNRTVDLVLQITLFYHIPLSAAMKQRIRDMDQPAEERFKCVLDGLKRKNLLNRGNVHFILRHEFYAVY